MPLMISKVNGRANVLVYTAWVLFSVQQHRPPPAAEF